MPYISMFFGIIIRMFYNDHPPSHFHAEYQGQRGIFDFDGNMTQGNLTSRTAQRLIREWASQHREELGACRREKAMAHYKALRLVHSRPFAEKHHLSAFESVLVREACLSVGFLSVLKYLLIPSRIGIVGTLIPCAKSADASR